MDGGNGGEMERLCEAGENLEIWRVHHTRVREQDKNARVMPPEMMERLIQNLRNERRMESLPFGVMREGFVELISGHHRCRAAVAAGITEYLVLVDVRDLPAERVKAKQLAHNSIAGADNETILRQIFSEITSVEARLESFVYVDDSFLKGIDASVKMVNEEISIKWPVLAVTFLPSQLARYEHVAERLAKQIPKDTDQVWLINDEMAKAFSETLNRIGRHFDIRTNGNIIARMVEIVNAELDREAAAASPPAVEQEQPEQPETEQPGSENPEGRLAGRTRRRSSTNAGSKPAPRSNSGEPAEGSAAA